MQDSCNASHLQLVARQLSPIALHTVDESKQQVLLDSHEGVTVGRLHVAGNIDGNLLARDLVQKDTPVQLLYDAWILPDDLAHVCHHCT